MFIQGPFEVGSAVIVRNNLINLMLDLADSDDVVREVRKFFYLLFVFKNLNKF